MDQTNNNKHQREFAEPTDGRITKKIKTEEYPSGQEDIFNSNTSLLTSSMNLGFANQYLNTSLDNLVNLVNNDNYTQSLQQNTQNQDSTSNNLEAGRPLNTEMTEENNFSSAIPNFSSAIPNFNPGTSFIQTPQNFINTPFVLTPNSNVSFTPIQSSVGVTEQPVPLIVMSNSNGGAYIQAIQRSVPQQREVVVENVSGKVQFILDMFSKAKEELALAEKQQSEFCQREDIRPRYYEHLKQMEQ